MADFTPADPALLSTLQGGINADNTNAAQLAALLTSNAAAAEAGADRRNALAVEALNAQATALTTPIKASDRDIAIQMMIEQVNGVRAIPAAAQRAQDAIALINKLWPA